MTKCVNCRFSAKDKDGDISGRIRVSERGAVYLFVDGQGNKGFLADRMQKMRITDFEIIPRDPETYRDWQVGDRVCEDEHRNACYKVIFRSGELVVFKDWNNWASNPMTCSEAFTRFGMRLVLTDIEQQIIEEKRKQKYEPQDGDICFVEDKNGYQSIFISAPGSETSYYVSYGEPESERKLSIKKHALQYKVMDERNIKILRPATDKEKQLLFDAMLKQGKRWNAEKKVVEDIPKPYEFRKGEPVLVRDEGGKWRIGVFIQREDSFYGYRTRPADGIGEIGYRYCLPYNERTMHLLGTTDDYKEE